MFSQPELKFGLADTREAARASAAQNALAKQGGGQLKLQFSLHAVARNLGVFERLLRQIKDKFHVSTLPQPPFPVEGSIEG